MNNVVRTINPEPTLIIAEAGVNHNGCLNLAFKLVDVAVDAGVDIVKFQTFKAELLVTQEAEQALYQKKNTFKSQSQYTLLKGLELSYDDHLAVKAYCETKNIEYLSTAFDLPSLKFLVDDMKLNRLKIPSGELTNTPFVLAHAITGCDLIISTGMGTIAEIRLALGTVAFGYLYGTTKPPSAEAFESAFLSKEGQKLLKEKVVLLHCTTEYPAPFDEINLSVLSTLKSTFNLSVGYSDHTQGILVPSIAVTHGACIIEKHFTLDCELPGPDHKASIEPDELKTMVKEIRISERIMGHGIKQPSQSELSNMHVARKSLVALENIKAGEVFTENNLGAMRPGQGISPEKYWEVINQKAVKDFVTGELITF